MLTADNVINDAITDLVMVLENESDHEGITVKTQWATDIDAYAIRCECAACSRHWQHVVTGNTMSMQLSTRDLTDMFRRDIVPFFQKVTRDNCYSLKESALLAEWITHRLVEVGAAGIGLQLFVNEASSSRLAPPKDVHRMLIKMKIIEEGLPIRPVIYRAGPYPEDPVYHGRSIYLPADHPLCTWREK